MATTVTFSQDIMVLVGSLLALFATALVTHAFNFSFNSPTSCDDLTVSWTGGTPPFHLTIFPAFHVPQNFTIPETAFADGSGTFSTPLTLDRRQRLLLSMSDATGFNTGGVSRVLKVGASQSDNRCNISENRIDFLFWSLRPLVQCSNFVFENYPNAVLPVTVIGMVAGGPTFVLTGAGNSLEWIVNVTAGTTMMFTMIDAQGRQGGTTPLKTVEPSDDNTCIEKAITRLHGCSSDSL